MWWVRVDEVKNDTELARDPVEPLSLVCSGITLSVYSRVS